MLSSSGASGTFPCLVVPAMVVPFGYKKIREQLSAVPLGNFGFSDCCLKLVFRIVFNTRR
jgi:hypothetical protein